MLKRKGKSINCPYTNEYVETLWECIKDDLQDNSPVCEEDYLKVLLSACKSYNVELGTETFDIGG